MFRSLFYTSLLVGLLAAAFFLPKFVQESDKFQPLSDSMMKDVTPPPAPEHAPAKTPAAAAPAPEVSASTPVPPPTPKPKAEAPMPTPPPPAPLDLSPFVMAMASGDLSKAATWLETSRPTMDAAKYEELSKSLELAKAREAPKPAPAPAPAAADTATAKALAETQALVVDALRQLQQSQKETSQLIAELKQRPAPEPKAPSPAPASESTPPPPAPVNAPSAPTTPLPPTVVLQYGFDSSVLEETESAKLEPVISALKGDAKTKVELRGYADKKGSSSYNLGLSSARAQSAKDALRAAGVPDDRIVVVSFGSFQASTGDAAKPDDYRKVEVMVIR